LTIPDSSALAAACMRRYRLTPRGCRLTPNIRRSPSPPTIHRRPGNKVLNPDLNLYAAVEIFLRCSFRARLDKNLLCCTRTCNEFQTYINIFNRNTPIRVWL
jgi:hypothetical protein